MKNFWIYLGKTNLWIILLILGFSLINVRQNSFFGFRFPAALKDKEIWKKINRMGGLTLGIISSIALILDTVGWFLKAGDSFYIFIEISFIILIVLYSIFLYVYSKKLYALKYKKNEKSAPDIYLSYSYKWFMVAVSAITITGGITMLFIPQNTFIGLRISKTFQSASVWHMANTFSGIGFIFIGIVFLILFVNQLKIQGNDTKQFGRYVIAFILLLIVWATISIVYAYLI
jgi:uncharacterized membrane protein